MFSLDILATSLFISAIQLLLLWVLGIGLARLLLTDNLSAHQATLAPLFGLALIALIGYYGIQMPFGTMHMLLPMTLVLALLLFALSVATNRHWCVGTLPLREMVPLLLMMGVTWLLNVLPVLHYGTLIPIGNNWDVEFYLPLADYLTTYSLPTLPHAPANPLRDLLLTERIASRAMGATYAQSMVDVLLSRDAWDTWVPLLALLRALTLAGVYGLLRDGFGIKPAAALAGVALAGINSLLLWTTYNSFGMGIGGVALLPATILCTLHALNSQSSSTTNTRSTHRRALWAAIVLLAGLTATYWPMLMAYGAACLGSGVGLLWQYARRAEWHIIGHIVRRGIDILVGAAVLAMLVHLRASVAFVEMFVARTPAMGITDFLSPLALLGTAPFDHHTLATTPTISWLIWSSWIGGIAALVLLGSALWHHTQRTLIAGMVITIIVYVLGLRFVVGYAYGVVRGASYVNTLIVACVGAGIVTLPTLSIAKYMRLWAYITWLLFLFVIVSSGIATYQTYRVYADKPGVFELSSVGMRQAVANLKQPGAVLVSSAPELRGTYTGAFAYALRARTLYGVMATGYRPLVNVAEAAPNTLAPAPAYGMLYHNDDPRDYGFDPAALVWHDERAALYAAPVTRTAWLNGRTTSRTEGQYLLDDTTLSRALIGTGDYLSGDTTSPLVLHIAPTATPLATQYAIALASFIPQTATIVFDEHTNQQTYKVNVPAGVSLYYTYRTQPQTITIAGDATPLYVRWVAAAHTPDDSPPNNKNNTNDTLVLGERWDDTLMVALQANNNNAQPHVADITMQIANTGAHAVRFAIEVYEVVEGYQTVPAHYAWSLFPVPPDGVHTIQFDVQTPALMLNNIPQPMQTGTLHDGHYVAALWVYQGEQVRRVIPFLHFQRQQGNITAMVPRSVNATFVRMQPPAQLFTPHAAASFGNLIALHGATIDCGDANTMVHSGEQVRVTLAMQSLATATTPLPPEPYLVFVQMLDAHNHKVAEWNGAAGGDWHPTPAWQPHQHIWQDIPLRIADDAPAGTYRIIAGFFHAATGERLALPDGATSITVGDVVVDAAY